MFQLDYADGWDFYFQKLDKSEKEKIWKKIQHLKNLPSTRHLMHGLPYFVVETEQCRICFEEIGIKRRIMFAGKHKQYEKWIKKQ